MRSRSSIRKPRGQMSQGTFQPLCARGAILLVTEKRRANQFNPSPWIVHKGNSQSIHSMATINLSELKTQPTLGQCSCLGQRFVTQGGFRVFSASDLMDFGFRSAPGGPLKTLRLAWLGLRLWFILSQACQAIGAACLPVVVADGAGLAGTTAMMTYDGDLRTYF